jgi:hypothetical protein
VEDFFKPRGGGGAHKKILPRSRHQKKCTRLRFLKTQSSFPLTNPLKILAISPLEPLGREGAWCLQAPTIGHCNFALQKRNDEKALHRKNQSAQKRRNMRDRITKRAPHAPHTRTSL